jgi:hypothetical protein
MHGAIVGAGRRAVGRMIALSSAVLLLAMGADVRVLSGVAGPQQT